MDAQLSAHVEALRLQASFTRQALRTAADVLDRVLAGDPTPHQIDQARSQARAAMRSLRLTNQLLAQAAELIDRTAQGGSADDIHPAGTRTRVG